MALIHLDAEHFAPFVRSSYVIGHLRKFEGLTPPPPGTLCRLLGESRRRIGLNYGDRFVPTQFYLVQIDTLKIVLKSTLHCVAEVTSLNDEFLEVLLRFAGDGIAVAIGRGVGDEANTVFELPGGFVVEPPCCLLNPPNKMPWDTLGGVSFNPRCTF
jgi:hypothetical protein